MHAGIPNQLLPEFVKGLKRWSKDGDVAFTYGTIFSCSEISSHVIQALLGYYAQEFDVKVDASCQFHAEIDKTRAAHIMHDFPRTTSMYSDVGKMGRGKF